MDPLAAKATALVSSHLGKLLGRQASAFLGRNDIALAEAWDRDRRDFIFATFRELRAVSDDLRRQIGNLDERVREQAADEQFDRIWENFSYESVRSALAARREMLAAAAAAVVDPRLTIEEKARVERTLRGLDPDDVGALHGIHRTIGVVDSRGEEHESPGALRYAVAEQSGRSDTLIASGCMRARMVGVGGFGGTGHDELSITATGRHVLHVLRFYLRKVGFPFVPPGRESEIGGEELHSFEQLLADGAVLGRLCAETVASPSWPNELTRRSALARLYVPRPRTNAGIGQEHMASPHVSISIVGASELQIARVTALAQEVRSLGRGLRLDVAVHDREADHDRMILARLFGSLGELLAVVDAMGGSWD